MRQAESSRDTVQRRENSCLRDAVQRLTARHQAVDLCQYVSMILMCHRRWYVCAVCVHSATLSHSCTPWRSHLMTPRPRSVALSRLQAPYQTNKLSSWWYVLILVVMFVNWMPVLILLCDVEVHASWAYIVISQLSAYTLRQLIAGDCILWSVCLPPEDAGPTLVLTRPDT